jgi:hypothetical protein
LYSIAADTFDNLMDSTGATLMTEAMQRYPGLSFTWPTAAGTMQELVGLALDALLTTLLEKRFLDQHIATAIRQVVKGLEPQEQAE